MVSIVVLAALLAACAHSPTQRRRQVARTAVAVAGVVVLIVGVGLLYGLVGECEQPGGSCRAPDRSEPR